MTTENEIQSESPPTAPAPELALDDAASKRPVGRPSNAQLDARQAELDRREAELAERKRELELAAAEQNMLMREAEMKAAEERIIAARSGTIRSQTIRSDGIRDEEIRTPMRTRKFKGAEMPNKFEVAKSDIPAGMSYQWNNHSIFGQEQHAYSAFMEQQGWEPVPASRHPHLMPTGYEGPIIVDGQILMERPTELTLEALQEELDRARGEVRLKEEQLGATPQGTMPRSRDNGTNEFIRVSKEIEPGVPTQPKYEYEVAGAGGAVIE